MSKNIIYHTQAQKALMNGIDHIASSVAATYGSHGSAVLVKHRTNGMLPVLTRDGLSVAQSIVCQDRIEEIGGKMLRDIARAVSKQVGDGTTTAVILAQRIAKESMKRIAAGYDPVQIKKGLKKALVRVDTALLNQANNADTRCLQKIVNMATKNEDGVAKKITDALEELGSENSLMFELGDGCEDRVEIINGIHYQQGYLSPNFVTDKNRSLAILENPYILLCDETVSDLMDLIPILEQVKEQQRSLLIIADDVVDKALTGLVLNHARGVFTAVAVKPPGFGDKRSVRLADMALLTNGTYLNKDYNGRLEHVTLKQLGQARRAIISAEDTTIIGASNDFSAIAPLIKDLRQQIEIISAYKPGQGSATGNQHELEEIEERLRTLFGKTGIYHVGGVSDCEIKERMARIQNAYHSAKAAQKEGVVAGGGAALFCCTKTLDEITLENEEQQQGVAILQSALAAPLQQLCHNAGINYEQVQARLCHFDNEYYALDTQTGQYGNFYAIGVVDPVSVIRSALRHAVSFVSMLISTEVIVAQTPDTSIMAGYSPEWAAATREDPRM